MSAALAGHHCGATGLLPRAVLRRERPASRAAGAPGLGKVQSRRLHCSHQWLTRRFVQLKNTVRMRQGELGYSKSEQTYLYDLPVGVGDNCSSNRGAEGAYAPARLHP